MSNQRFSITPSTAATDARLSDSVHRTLSVIGIYGDKNGWCWPSQSTLAEMRGMSRKTINVHIKELIKFGYLNIAPRYDEDTGAQRSNMMQIKFDFEPDVTGGVTSRGLQGVSPLGGYRGGEVQEVTHNAPSNAPSNGGNKLLYHFQNQTGLMPNPGSYGDWLTVLDYWLETYADNAESIITNAVKFARGDNPQGKRYTITSPRSLNSIMANMPKDAAANGVVAIGSR